MYAASFGLVILALITLIIGVFQSGLTMIWVSIGSSVLAALFLAVGVLQKKPVQPATAGAPYGPPAGSSDAADERETAVIEAPARRRAAAPVATVDEDERETGADDTAADDAAADDAAVAASATTRKATARKTAPKKAPARTSSAKTAPSKAAAKGAPAKSAAKKSAAAAASGTGGQVVAIPERGTYHQASCRFVRGRRDTERLTKASAGRKGYTACGVCRP